jgi:hypothetical protein
MLHLTIDELDQHSLPPGAAGLAVAQSEQQERQDLQHLVFLYSRARSQLGPQRAATGIVALALPLASCTLPLAGLV